MSHLKGPDVLKALTDFRPDTSVLKLFVEKLRSNGDATAMIEGETGKKATFRELLQNVTSISAGLRREGVGSGDYVLFCCDKSIASFSALMGVMLTGATTILYPIPHIDVVKKLTRGFPIKAVFCDPQYLKPLETSLMQLDRHPDLVVTTGPTDSVFTSLMKTEGDLEVFDVRDPQKHIVAIYFSSGTTGVPKGVQITDIYIQMCGHCFDFGVKRFLLPSPMFWVSGMMAFMSSTFKQFTVVWSNSTEPKDNLHLLVKYKVDGWFTGTGTMSKYINEPTLNNYNLDCVKMIIVGGEYVVKSIYDDFINKVSGGRPIVSNVYGSTEGGFLANMNKQQMEGKFELGACGQLFAGVEMKILDENGALVPMGTLGEVWIKPLVLTPGYWGQPEVDREAFDEDGFLRISDAGFFDHKKELHLRGRFRDLITFKGNKVSPAEVEDILMSHPAVLDAAVVGKSHPTDNQHMTGYVVKIPGTHVTEDELKEFVDSKVEDRYRLRGGVHFLQALPRTIIGKVQRNILRDM